MHNPVFLKLSQLLRQHLLGDGRDRFLQFGKPLHLSAEELEKDQKLPSAFQHFQGLLHGMSRRDRSPFRDFADCLTFRWGAYFFVGSCHLAGS